MAKHQPPEKYKVAPDGTRLVRSGAQPLAINGVWWYTYLPLDESDPRIFEYAPATKRLVMTVSS